MLRNKQEETEEAHAAPLPSTRIPAPPQPTVTSLSEEDEVFLSRLRSGETLTGGERVLPTLVTPTQTISAPPSTLSFAEWWDHLITNNPVFHKETLAQRRTQEKKQGTTRITEKVLAVLAVLGLYAGMFYLMPIALASTTPQPIFWAMQIFLLVLECLVLMIAMPLQAATSVTAEREKMTWNAMLLSRNSPLQILMGKLAAHLRPIALFYGVLLPALIITAWGTGMGWTNFLAAQVMILVTTVFNASVAMYCSLNGKKSQQASSNAGGAVIIPILGLPGLTAITFAAPALIASLMNTTFSPDVWFYWLAFLPNIFNPLVALIASLTQPGWLGPSWPSWLWFAVPTFYLTVSSLGVRWLWKNMLKNFWSAPKDLSG